MIGANEALFTHLEAHCARRREPLINPGLRRYLRTSDAEKGFLKYLKIGDFLRFGHHRSLTHLQIEGTHYVALLGFDFDPELRQLSSVPVNSGMLLALLSETKPWPSATPAEIRNVVEVGSMDDPDYGGHEQSAIETLFPSVRFAQSSEPLDDESLWRIFLMVSAGECMRGGSWIEEDLATALVALTDLNVPSLPYPALCRSIFDLDPRTLFMALYRCIEATYAYESSRQLVIRLGIEVTWQEMAAALESEVGWHPQEASSLNVVLSHANEQDLAEICSLLGSTAGQHLPMSTGKALYSLRNGIVHFRPGTAEIPIDGIDWNRLCELLVSVVLDVFVRAFS